MIEDNIEVTLGTQIIKRPCTQNRLELGLTLFRCPPSLMPGQSEFSKKSWAESVGQKLSVNRLLSVGIDFSVQTKPSAIGTQLLQSSAVDLLYHFSLAPNEESLQNAVELIEQELAPWTLKDAQLIIISPTDLSPALLQNFAARTRVVTLNTQRDRANIEKLLTPGTQSNILEKEILAAIPQASITGATPPIVLTRPITTLGYLTVTTMTKNIPISAKLRLSRQSEVSPINGKNDESMEIPAGKWQIQAVASAGLRSKWIPVEIIAGEHQQISLDLSPVELEVQTLKDHQGLHWSVAFSPDGKTLASASGDETIKLWNITNGSLKATLLGHTDSVTSITFSPNGQLLVSSSYGKTIKVWDLQTEKVIHTLTNNTEIYSVVFSPNGKILASSGRDSVQLWDVATWQNIYRLSDNTEWCHSAEFSSDEKHLVAICKDDYNIWDLKTGKLTQTVKWGHGFYPKIISISSDAQIVAISKISTTPDNQEPIFKLWNFTLNQEISTIETDNSTLTGIAFSSDNKILAVASTVDFSNNRILLLDVTTGTEIRREYVERTNKLAFSPDGQTLASGSGSIQLWQMYPKFTTPVWEAETKTGDQQ